MSTNKAQECQEQGPKAPKDFILIVMGPSACGKSEVASGLANHFNCKFLDGDSFHSTKSIQKMENGISLTDEDRIPWLRRLAQEVKKHANGAFLSQAVETATETDAIVQDAAAAPAPEQNSVQVVLACSALKKLYRDLLRTETKPQNWHNSSNNSVQTIFVYLDCSTGVLEKRISSRQNHFMKAGMLAGQLETLENPTLDEGECRYTIRVDGDMELSAILEFVERYDFGIFSFLEDGWADAWNIPQCQ